MLCRVKKNLARLLLTLLEDPAVPRPLQALITNFLQARRRAREKALELQKARLDSLAQEKARVFSKLDHMYTVMRKQE